MSLLSRLAVQAARAYGILSSNPNNVSADYLVVAGGGGSGGGGNGVGAFGGGGGAGGYRTSTFTLSTLNTYSIIVGAGGNGGALTVEGTKGNNSAVSGTGLTTVTSTGGGYGGGAATSAAGDAGGSGGSGGGGGGNSSGGAGGAGGTGNQGGYSPVEGYNGAGSITGGFGGGGGGSSAAATNQNGAAGTANSISGSSVTYAAGGSGTSGAAIAGTANTGNGAKGGGENFTGAAGGSGIVIISYTSATPKFVGGTITTSGGKQIHTFTSSGTLSPITPITASYLVVAGGGGGGSNSGGGAGAGGLQASSTTLYSGATYVVTVGAGGAGGASGGNNTGSNGSDSIVSGTGLTTLTSTGGGGGGKNAASPNGSNGGSGGGGGSNGATLGTGGTGVSGQGYAGGTGATDNATYRNGGGGGGASAVGSNGTSSAGGAGGNGTASSISGSSVTYAGGGGGASFTTGGAGGTGGGGAGTGGVGGAVGGSGTTNLGGGGGGGAGGNGGGGSGGSGIVIISYAGSQAFNGGLVTSSGGNTIHTFTSTGALTPLTNNLNNSLRFRSSASAYLNRTPTVAGNRKTWTFSAWVKRGTFGAAAQALLGAGTSSTVYDRISFESDSIRIVFNNGTYDVNTSSVYRDPSAWYHIVVAMDTTQATAANRTKIYVNGNQLTAFATASYPAQNHETNINNSIANSIGALYVGSWGTYLDGYMTDINFIDGQALEPYYFGNNDANGVWKPILYKGTYGTNGFYLTFGNTTSTTTLGYDSSPNGNNWTCNNISLTAGVTYDAMLDVPTNTSATVANYAVMNPLWKDGTTVIAQGNLDVSNGNYGGFSTLTIPTNSKFYAEFTVTATQGNQGVGLLRASAAYSGVISQADMFGSNAVTYYSTNGNRFVLGGGSTAYGASWGTIGDVIGIAVNTVDNQITFYKNNVSQGVITGLTSGIEWVFATGNQTNTGGGAWNFGQRPFAYTPPTGFNRLNTYNIPDSTIKKGNSYMDATLYTGNGYPTSGTQSITNSASFKPDLVWIKRRNLGGSNTLTDSVRGVNSQLFSDQTVAQETNTDAVTAFNANGFSLGTGTSGIYPSVNSNTGTYVGWQWQAGQGSTSSNTSGSITSTVSVNTTAGFSIVTYTGTGANATVGHGLGVAPKMVIVKNRTTAGDEWCVWHTSLTNATYYLYLNGTAAQAVDTTFWNSTAPTSTVINLGSNGRTNRSSSSMVCYAWAEIAGFSKFGNYTANGSTDGPFIYLGFRPKFVMIKNTNLSTESWLIIDSSRDTYNVSYLGLAPNSSAAETNGSSRSPQVIMDFLSNGIKLRGANNEINSSSNSYIYAAFAENPFKNSNAR